MTSDERKFKIIVKVPKEGDKDKTEDKDFEISLDPKLFDDGKEFDHTHKTSDDKEYKITGKAVKGWFSDSIDKLKVVLENKELKEPKAEPKQWRYKGPIAVGVTLLVVVILFVWWWMSSNKESKEEEGL